MSDLIAHLHGGPRDGDTVEVSMTSVGFFIPARKRRKPEWVELTQEPPPWVWWQIPEPLWHPRPDWADDNTVEVAAYQYAGPVPRKLGHAKYEYRGEAWL